MTTTHNNNLYYALKILVDSSTDMQCKMRNHYQNQTIIHPKQWLKEYCTIKMCSARQTGHSSSLLQLAKEHYDNVLFLSPNITMSKRLQEKWLPYCCYIIYNHKNFHFESIKSKFYEKYIAFNNLDAIMIDNSYFMSNSDIENIYNLAQHTLKHDKNTYVIFVQ
jgi:hypothetical protein